MLGEPNAQRYWIRYQGWCSVYNLPRLNQGFFRIRTGTKEHPWNAGFGPHVPFSISNHRTGPAQAGGGSDGASDGDGRCKPTQFHFQRISPNYILCGICQD